MHARRWYPLALLASLGGMVSCSDESTKGTPDATTPAREGGTEAGPAAEAGSEAGVAEGGVSFRFTGEGCEYSVEAQSSRGFIDYAASSATAPGSAPARVRLGLGGGTDLSAKGYADPSKSVVVLWETATKTPASQIRFGDSASSLTTERAGFSFVSPGPERGPGVGEPEVYFHEVHLCGLTPGKTYYYQVGGGTGTDAWSAVQSFTTVPASGPITVGVLGDSRDSSDIFQMVAMRMKDADVDMQLFTGDLLIWGTQPSLYAKWLDAIWKDPKDPTKFLTLGNQLMVFAPGNHENMAPQFFANFVLPGSGAYAEQFASFNVGSAHVVVLDDEAIASDHKELAEAQLAWLEKDLAAAKGLASRKFTIVMHHRGVFTTGSHEGEHDVLAVRRKLVPLYDKYGVDLVLAGHDHHYERTKSIQAGTDIDKDPRVVADGTGTVYIIAAGAGASGYTAASNPDYRAKQLAYKGTSDLAGVYGLLTIDSDKLTWKGYGLKRAATRVAEDQLIETVTISPRK